MNQHTLEQIQQQYGTYCASIIRRILEDPRDCEECMNDVWLRIWKSAEPSDPSKLKGWVGAIARNCALTRLHQLERQNVLLDECTAELAFSLQNGPAEQLDGKLLGEAISRFLHTQPERNRIVFLRRYWYADSVEEAANHMGWSVSKTKTVLFRMRNKLKDYLNKEGYLDGKQ